MTVQIKTLEEKRNYLISKCTNDFQIDFIECLGIEVLEEVADVVHSCEFQFKEEVNFNLILEQSMVYAIHSTDFNAEYKIEIKCPNANYIALHQKASNSNYWIEMDDRYCTLNINLTNEHYIILKLTDSIAHLCDIVFDNSIADKIKLVDVENNREFEVFH